MSKVGTVAPDRCTGVTPLEAKSTVTANARSKVIVTLFSSAVVSRIGCTIATRPSSHTSHVRHRRSLSLWVSEVVPHAVPLPEHVHTPSAPAAGRRYSADSQVSSNADGQQKRDSCAKRTRPCAFRLAGSGPPPTQDEDSHWRRRPHAIRIEPFPSAGRVYTGKQASGGLGLCWSVCGGENRPPSAPTPPPTRRPQGRLPRRSSRPSDAESGICTLPRKCLLTRH